ncbi:hypothetical protein [Halobacillus sp. H74]|uniref:hypothetical protein n=1 Tax=Halobacillus sp. H74 TaxID=3457436 RepID=UPI003FCCA8B4
MKYASVQDIREGTSFEEVSYSMSDAKIEKYNLRAERWIHRITNNRFDDEIESEILMDLQRAVILIVDYLWFHDQPDVLEESLDPIQSERIGSYSYTKDKRDFMRDGFGNPELDSILESLKVVPAVNFFSISGPSRRR